MRQYLDEEAALSPKPTPTPGLAASSDFDQSAYNTMAYRNRMTRVVRRPNPEFTRSAYNAVNTTTSRRVDQHVLEHLEATVNSSVPD